MSDDQAAPFEQADPYDNKIILHNCKNVNIFLTV